MEGHEVQTLREEVEAPGSVVDSARAVVRWAARRFHPDLVLASSFGAEDCVLVDMLAREVDDPRVFTLDTGRLPEETHRVMEEVRDRYGIGIEVYFPDREAVEELTRKHGTNPFYRSLELRKRCCHIRKVEPLGRALQGREAWMTGLRREQSPTREDVRVVEPDEDHGSIAKVNPLVDWSWDDVWDYIREHDVPYNALYDRGYKSIGCAPCTRPVGPGEPERAGRWWWEDEDTKECGLHDSGEVGESGGAPTAEAPARRAGSRDGRDERPVVRRPLPVAE